MEKPIHSQYILQTERTIPYTPDEIYGAFAHAERLAKWWGPKGFTNTFTICEFKVGGLWNFIMHGPDGSHYQNDCVFAELEPGLKVVIRHLSLPHFTLSVSLIPSGTNTRILWIQEFEDQKTVETIRHIVEPCNEQNLDRLLLHLRGEL